MSILFVYSVSSPDLPNKVLTHFEDIATTLGEQGVKFERLQAATSIAPGASPEEVLGAFQAQIADLTGEHGDTTSAVISLREGHPQADELRAGLLQEHQHDVDELRFFVAGRGLLNLHIGDLVFAVQCEKHDLMSIPAGTRQWFDIGERPHLIAIRLFKGAQGDLARFTGADLAARFPRLDD
jgi:1,2-dihydroxy-3-keto-5-methylthiopentene dioxygenase